MNTNDYIKNRRIELGLTIKQVADAVGVSEGTVSRWESGKINNMRRDKIYALSKVLDIDPLIIMGRSDNDGAEEKSVYYSDPEAARMLQDIYDNSYIHALFMAAKGSRPEDVRMVTEMLERFKRTNPDG